LLHTRQSGRNTNKEICHASLVEAYISRENNQPHKFFDVDAGIREAEIPS
ncbi:hypothetical protein F441_22478, partial [Phytophthora nicotianae CJ01A1]